MANQMIALQARGPQLPDVGAMNARYANIMANMTAARQKQDEIARAAEFRRRAESGLDVLTPEGFNQLSGLDPQGAAALRKSALENRKADAEFTLAYLGTVNEELQRANTPEQARAIGQTLKQAYPTFADRIDQTLAEMPDDPAQFPSFRQRLNLSALKASERIEYEIAKVTTELATSETGTPLIVTRGGLNAPTIKQPRSLIRAPSRTGTVEVGEQTTVAPGVGGPEAAPMAAPESTAPMMPGAKSPRLSASMASSLLGLRNNADYQVALQAIKRADPAAAEELQRIMPVFDPALSDAIREAAMAEFEVIPQGGPQGLVTGERGGVGGPDEGYIEAPTPFRLKNPSVSPYPGSAQVPLPRVAGEARATEGGKQGVRVETEPVIAGKSKEAELAAQRYSQLKTDIPRAHSQVSSLVGHLTDRINRIDKFLRNPYRNTVIGSIEGRIPEALMNERRADAIADWNFIKNNSVIDKLLQDRQSTETGASPQGMVSDRDLGIAATAANSLTRTGSEPSQEEELKRLRDVLYRTREAAMRTYSNTYSELVQADPRFRLKPRPVSPKYTGPLDAKRTRSGATVENWD